MANTDDLSVLSDEELMEEWTAEGEANQASRDLLAAFSAEHQRRVREQQLRSALGSLSAEDLELIQNMAPDGVESQEEVGVKPDGQRSV